MKAYTKKEYIYIVNHLLDKGKLRSIEHFRNLGVNSEEALIILEIYKAIPDSWKEATAVAKFQQVDELTFSLNIREFSI